MDGHEGVAATTAGLGSGLREIAAFYNLPVAKAGRMARQNLLPGVFRLGRGYFLDEVTAREIIKEKALGDSRVRAEAA